MKYIKIIMFLFFMTGCNADSSGESLFHNEDLSEIIQTIPSALIIEIYYIPRGLHLPSREHIKEASQITVKYHGDYWQQPLRKLQEIKTLNKFTPDKEPMGWLSEIVIKSRGIKNETTYFTIQMADFGEIIAVNGVYYKTNTEILNWYRVYIMPILNSINHGIESFDELELRIK